MGTNLRMKRDVVKAFVGGLIGTLIGGLVLLFWFGFSGDYVMMTTVITFVAAAAGAGIGYGIREHANI